MADPSTGLAQATSIPIPSASVTLTSPGDQPLRSAALVPDTSSPQRVTLSTRSSETSTTAETIQSIETPLTARFGCSATGELNLVLGTPTSAQSELSGQLGSIAGSIAGITLGPQHSPLALRLRPTDASSAPARRAVEQSLVQALQNSIVLPAEPIGVGATWRSERTIAGAATVDQVIESRITRWEGNRITITFTSDESPVNSVFTIPGGNTQLTIDRYSYSGSGEITVDLSRGLPVSGSAEYAGARELVGSDPNQPLLQRIGFTMSWA